MTLSPQITPERQEALDSISQQAREYYEQRDKLEVARQSLVESILGGVEGQGVSQHQAAGACDLRAEQPKEQPQDREWAFHRTRIQQFLREARMAA